MAAGNYTLPSPQRLEIHDPQAADKWKKFKRAWENYALATELSKKSEQVQVATLLTVIGEEAREVYSTFTGWAAVGDSSKIDPVLNKFEEYCKPRKNIPFERYRFNRRTQESGESYDQYRTSLRQLAESCDFATITPDEILRDRLVFGIRDAKARERLLREPKLSLDKTDEICRAAESMVVQLKLVEGSAGSLVNAVKEESASQQAAHKEGSNTRKCWNCGRKHDFQKRELCPAYGKTCNKCHKPNHFAIKCRSKATPKSVKVVEESEEICQTHVSGTPMDDSQFVTVKLENGSFLRFQADTGAQCNVVPVHLYKKATKDFSLSKVTPCQSKITAYGGTTIPVVGSTLLRVWRGETSCRLDCKIVSHSNVRPLLGRKACLHMKIVSYLDNDMLHKPETDGSEVFTLTTSRPWTIDTLLSKYPNVFGEGIGCLEGEYHIRLDPEAVPVQHAPRRVHVPLRERLEETLDDLVQQDILATVTEPTPWINSMVVVPKKDGKLRICLDPKDLNLAIQREHYPLPTIEEIATRLHGAKLFTVLDARHGFWHIRLDEPSSYLTTFNTRYRWKRMPFGISSAPEVFQRRMHEVIEGLKGVEVVADDFVVVGFGTSIDEATRNHDCNLEAFLDRCAERNLKLNDKKTRLRLQEVPFIGHVATSEGLRVDPYKVQAIREMPPPADVAAVQRLLGLTQYLSKFLPHLSDLTKPLRELTQKDTAWEWGEVQQKALEQLKAAVSSTPVLRYYVQPERGGHSPM